MPNEDEKCKRMKSENQLYNSKLNQIKSESGKTLELSESKLNQTKGKVGNIGVI